MKKVFMVLMFLSNVVFGHTALMNCFDNADGTITCQGGFSNGKSATGLKITILQDSKPIIDGVFGEDGEFSFKKPNGDFQVVLDAGEGHKVFVSDKDIVK